MKKIKKQLKKPWVQYGLLITIIIIVVTFGIVQIINEEPAGEIPTKEERLQKEIDQIEIRK